MKQKELLEAVDAAVRRFKGNSGQLESAIGALFVGRHYGWKVLYLIHDKKTLKRYEEILGLGFREVLDEEGPLAQRSVAWVLAQKVGNFWRAVKGEIKGVRTPELTR